ncbi:MAG: thiamine pyrophosphate-dependent enzyme [Dehalococcoidia bacterium]
MTDTFPTTEPIWCAGCGHFAVLGALDGAFDRLSVPRHDSMVLAGIGCSGTIQNHVRSYGYHALHGRVLPTATGAKLANSSLTIVAAGGDGDGLAIGVGHLVHTFRTNPGFTYIMLNNGTYGLTKGNASPSSPEGFKGTTADRDADPIMLGLSIPGTTFLARGYSGAMEQLVELTDAAIAHTREGRGFAFLEVISPCVAYNDRYQDWRSRLQPVDTDPGYDPTDRGAAFAHAIELREQGRLPTGLIYRGEADSLETTLGVAGGAGPAHQDITSDQHRSEYRSIMESFRR